MMIVIVRVWLSNSGWIFNITERQFIFRINASILCASFAAITRQQGFTSVLHRHLWPLTPSLPVHRAHNSDLSLWHTNSCVGGSEQSVDHYLPWLIDNRLQKNTNRESREKNTPVTDTRNPELWLHKQRLSNITGNNGSVCVCAFVWQLCFMAQVHSWDKPKSGK